MHPRLAATLFALAISVPSVVSLVGCAVGTVDPTADFLPTTDADASVTAPSNDSSNTGDAGKRPATGNDAGNAAPVNDAGSQPPPDDASPPPPPPQDSGPPPQDAASACSDYADPNTPAACNAGCTTHNCTLNGCYNGYYCHISVTKCVAKPSSCP